MTSAGIVTHRAAAIGTWTTCAAAILCLPRSVFPFEWLAAFVLPALLFYALRWRADLDFGWAIAWSAAAHVLTVLGAQWSQPDIAHVTALGCALLPPMVFLAARRRGDDTTWAVFLALCVFLIAVIVGGNRSPWSWQLWAFVGAALVALQLETRARAAARARVVVVVPGTRRRTLASVSGQLLMSLSVATIVLQAFDRIDRKSRPTPRFRDFDSAPASQGQVGLDDRFEFGPAAQQLFDLERNELVRVTTEGLAHELYLRTAHFELAGLDRWTKAQPRDQESMFEEDVRHLGYPSVEVPTERITIDASADTGSFLFLPPGTLRVRGVGLVYGNARRERFQRLESGPATYAVEFQDRRPIAAARPLDAEFRVLPLPRELRPHLSHFDRVLDDAGIHRDASPIEAAHAIVAVLQRDCEYEMREPTGPYEHTILNFLSGERRGFCMHFASALAICLQRDGIPARVAVGLYAGADEAIDDTLVLGSQHAHAWVEVPIEGVGWVVVDPTPTAMAGIGGDLAAASPNRRWTESIAAARRFLGRHSIWIAVAALGIGSLLVFGRGARAGKPHQRDPAHVHPHATQRFRRLLAHLANVAPRRHGQTLWSYATELRAAEGMPIDAIERAFTAYEEMRFGRRPFDVARRDSIDSAIDAIRKI